MKTKGEAFWSGMIVGAIVIMFVLIFTGLTPTDQLKKDRKAAIAHGAAHWTVDTNGVTTFEWNK